MSKLDSIYNSRCGAKIVSDDQIKFKVWAPYTEKINLLISKGNGDFESYKMRKASEDGDSDENFYGDGLYSLTISKSKKETIDYFFLLNETKKRPDPTSNFQPFGVHKESRVIDHLNYEWKDEGWKGIKLEDLIMYELHTGTFTKNSTFESIISFIDYFKDLGVNAIELMPVGQFPGDRNWGYDGTFIYAVQNSYGGPSGLKNLVNTCHQQGLAVILDVVYNHMGPEGNYLYDYGPYFSDKYKTPWGSAVNYDSLGCDYVRDFIINNALFWVKEYHIDGLRLDAIHGIFDFSPKNILQEITEKVHLQSKLLDKEVLVIAESDLNDPKIINSVYNCGYGFDAQWSDDFHHSVHSFLTAETTGYYSDFGKFEHILKSISNGYVYDGDYSFHRGRRHGASSKHLDGKRFIVGLQNHDQIGNRADGKRLASLLSPAALKVAAGLLILSPYVPLLFMGEEYAEIKPFYYFTSHGDPQLIEAVREGRKKEFKAFGWDYDIDPQDISTFQKCKINIDGSTLDNDIFKHYRKLISLRKKHPVFQNTSRENMNVKSIDNRILIVKRWKGNEEVMIIYNLSDAKYYDKLIEDGKWIKIYHLYSDLSDSKDEQDKIMSEEKEKEIFEQNTYIELKPYDIVLFTRY